jgi:hypothetical protein
MCMPLRWWTQCNGPDKFEVRSSCAYLNKLRLNASPMAIQP